MADQATDEKCGVLYPYGLMRACTKEKGHAGMHQDSAAHCWLSEAALPAAPAAAAELLAVIREMENYGAGPATSAADRVWKWAQQLRAAVHAQPEPPAAEPLIGVIDGRCGCEACRRRTENIYRMVGACINCGAKPFLMLFRAGDPASNCDCPVCGGSHRVQPQRLATDDEIPSAARAAVHAQEGPRDE